MLGFALGEVALGEIPAPAPLSALVSFPGGNDFTLVRLVPRIVTFVLPLLILLL